MLRSDARLVCARPAFNKTMLFWRYCWLYMTHEGNIYNFFKDLAEQWNKLSRAPLGYSAERAPLGGGAYSAPCLTPELIGAARRARRRSKALDEKNPMRIKKIFKRSHVRSRSGHRSEMCFRIIAHRDRAINSRAPKLS